MAPGLLQEGGCGIPPHYMILYCTQLTYTILSCYILYCTILYHSMLYYAILWCTLLWYNCGDSIPTPSTTLCCTPVLRSLSRRWIWYPIALYDIVLYSIAIYIYIRILYNILCFTILYFLMQWWRWHHNPFYYSLL